VNSIYLFLTFISSFSTMAYAMITSSIISDFTGEEIFSQCLTMGPYLLGLGLGSVFGDKVSNSKTMQVFWKLEWVSILMLPLIPLVHLAFIFLYLHLSPIGTTLESRASLQIILGFAAVISFVTGVLGGGQLPLIIREVSGKLRAEIVLGANYMGPLFAGPFIVYASTHAWPASVQAGSVALLQGFGLFLLVLKSTDRVKRMLLLSIPVLFIMALAKFYPRFEFLTVKASYVETKASWADILKPQKLIHTIDTYATLERVRTPYQTIDFFITPGFPEVASPANFTLYLNRKTQFDSFAVDIYHQSMVYAGINLLKKVPESVLILGAGDGLLLTELKKYKEIKTITMVELDQGIIDWAATNPIMSGLNEHSLTDKDPRVELIVTDAVSWLRRHSGKMKYDMVLIDFPFPNGHELSKLYSLELYTLVKRVLNQETIVVIDMPIVYVAQGEVEPETLVILKTLKAASFNSRLAFGPHASFLATSLKDQELKFDFSTLPDSMALSARLNLVEILNEEDVRKTENSVPVNSMFWPRGL
jgi:spermidine synthase